MSQPIRGQGGHLVFSIGLKNTNLVEDVEIWLLSSFVEFRWAVSEEKAKMPRSIRGKGGNKSTNLVEDVEILLPVKFIWIPFSGFRWEVENFSPNQRQRRSSCFSDRSEKHNLCRGRWHLASCQPKFHWIQLSSFRGEVENVSTNQRTWWPFCFSDRPEKHKLGRGCWDVDSGKFRWILLSSFKGEFENVSVDQRPGRSSCFFPISPKKHKGTWQRTLRFCFLSSFVEFRWAVLEEKSNMFQQTRGQGGHLVFPIGTKNTLGRARCDLASCQVSLNFVQQFQRRSRKCLKQSEDRVADRPEKHKLGRGRWDVDSCQVSLNFVQQFQRRSRKCLNQSETRAVFLFFSDRLE